MSVPDLAPGTVVGGRYTVASRIGAGARSATYRASNGGASEVALKAYDPALPATMLDVLYRAGQAAAAVTSAALAPIDAGVDTATGVPFVVQELSARPSLAQLVELCPLAPADVAALARSLARALAPLHERAVAHGALAPTSVFVGPPPACEVRLSDFGAPGGAQTPAEAVATDVEGAARLAAFALTGRPFGSPGPQTDAAWSAVFRRAMHPRGGEDYASLDALADAFETAARGEGPRELAAAPARAPLATPALPLALPQASPAARAQAPLAVPWMIGLGAVALLVIAMSIAVAVKLARRSGSPEPGASVTAEPSAIEAPSAAPPPSAPPLASGEEETPAASASVAAADAPPAEEPTIPPGDHFHGLLVVTCKPSCDSVFVDGHAIAHADQGRLLAPGVHTVAGNLVNHTSRVQAVLLQRGRVKKLKLSF